MLFRDRGKRIEEQIELMRALWQQPSVTFQGKFHQIEGMGIAPRPAETIPVWMGGAADAVIDRIGRIADGFVRGGGTPPDQFPALVAAVKASLKRAGRDPSTFPITDQLMVAPGSRPADWSRYAEAAKSIGVTHFLVSTVRNGLSTAQQHIELAGRVLEAVSAVDR
jgi:alkanesulfonate monooxygenase SsuD/methylene tetrahydromethanopterin reductase-like flavin-dependent oxidoreductase (luciferase family)